MLTIKFMLEDGRVVTENARVGETVLAAARRANILIDAPCAGNGTCGKCRVHLEEGALSGEPGKHISKKDFAEGFRLACQCELTEAVTVSVPQSALAYQNRIRVADFSSAHAREAFEAMKNLLAEASYQDDQTATALTLKLKLKLAPPSLDDATADSERLRMAAALQLGVDADCINLTLHALRRLPLVLRENDFQLCVLARKEGGAKQEQFTIFDVYGGGSARLGVCVDIGTTTVSAALVDLNTKEFLATGNAGNAQIRYGADVIGRLVESARTDGVSRLKDAVTRECIRPLIEKLCETAQVSPLRITRAAIAGNTTMTHLLLGVYGNNIRLEPYVPAFFSMPRIHGHEADIGIHPDAEVLLAPSVGSYVGGDITAGIFASGIARGEALSLLIDLGTNGELVFGNRDFLMACACSAGPAFEGGEICCGMRATDGAITAVTIDADTMEPTYHVIGDEGQAPAGICGSGLIDTIGELFKAGIINAKGKFIREGTRIESDEWGSTRYTLVYADASFTGNAVFISDADIDNFIRAKGSIFSAIVTMLKSLDMEIGMLEKVYLAGGIGSGIDIPHAIEIGMLPKLPLECFEYIGNTSFSGAYAMLVSDKAAEEVEEIAQSVTYLELSSIPGYMDEFIAACFLPHTNASLFA